MVRGRADCRGIALSCGLREWSGAGGAAIISTPQKPSGASAHRAELWAALIFGEGFMHYPHRTSRIKRKRSIGFRARMKTKHGRKMMNRKRAAGRSLNVADK